MWFSLSKLAWQGLPRRGNTFPLEHNALAFAITPADRNGANNPSGLTPVFERKGFCTFFPLKGTLSALSGYPIFCPTGHLWSSLLTEDVVGAPSPLRRSGQQGAGRLGVYSITHGQKQGSSRGCRRWGLGYLCWWGWRWSEEGEFLGYRKLPAKP